MIDELKNRFGLTQTGAKNLFRACLVSFLGFCLQMLPMMIVMLYLQGLLSGQLASPLLFLLATLVTVILLYAGINMDYNATYTTTYKESANIRTDIAEILQTLPLSYFSSHDLSDLSQTIMSDVERLEHALSHAISKTLGFVLFFFLVSALMLMGNLLLGLCIVLPLLLIAGLIWLSKELPKWASAAYWQQLRANSESFQEAIELQEEIKAYNLGAQLSQKLYRQMEASEKLHLKTEILQGLPVLAAGVGLRLTLGLVVLVGSWLLAQGQLPLLYFLGYLLATVKIIDGMEGLYMNVAEILYINAAVRRIKELREAPKQQGQDVFLRHFDIELDGVGFAYKEGQPVLQDVSFTAKQKEITALVGPSGCGKTSLLRLISRLYDYQEGQIRIDGQELKEISTNSLFDSISIVFQDVSLFNASVLENIRLGRPDASDEEVLAAARQANCQAFVEALPDGYDSLVGENGAKLSGGERQRISIARALLKQAPIVILDEITSSLDIENEKLIQESLSLLLRDKTVIIISHRLKSIENADKIVVLKDGRVDGIGRHRELLQTSAVYQELVETSRLIEAFKYNK
ncbi:ABC transporter ATP-binding protein [Streptococcus panodentis]|uniref:ABC transporter ATP-binding protein n=1 Tax=Streptococcus panodentis TaxID=1581472 RepID=A0ABS5ATX8_9STRE|nr:ABC transporter ATP-binding protein [Streptococcus panodentis]MBP2620022.1 ABC transporter ATP-binding protein [Streptococcus panodentis]